MGRSFDLEAVRKHLSSARGREYWRCLEELAETDEFRELLRREFPRQAAGWLDAIDRRSFLKFMGASLALAGLSGCLTSAPAPTDEKIVPYVTQPEEIVPGKPLFFATAFTLAGFATGLLVETHEGRPTKIEGNPNHPASLGATSALAQASILTLYDPERSQSIINAGMVSTWNSFFSELNDEMEEQRLSGGAGLRILTETVTSPTLAEQMHSLLANFPKAKWHQFEPVGRDYVREGSRLAFGEIVETHYRFDRADVILSIDCDFLFHGPAAVRYARDFANQRRMESGKSEMNRLYVVESTPTVTGSMADHRLPLRPGEIEVFARAVARGLGIEVTDQRATRSSVDPNWLGALVRDLKRHRGRSVILAGEQQPPAIHALAHAMNHALGNVGQTVIYTEPVEAAPTDQLASLRELVKEMEAGQINVLIILGGNPVYTAPADFRFGDHLANVDFRVRLGLYEDETSALCHWHIPQAHYLESWSDGRAYDGTITIMQPMIAPLYGRKSSHELLSAIAGQPDHVGYDILRDYWRRQKRAADFELFWRTSLNDGVVADSALAAKSVTLKPVSSYGSSGSQALNPNAENRNSLEILFRPDPTIFDGRFANNGWLQETPKPLTKLTWDNAILLSPATAERLGISRSIGTTGGERGTIYVDVVQLQYRGRSIRGPAWILPGQADDCVTVHLGYGRTRAGRVGNQTGFNAYILRTSDTFWRASGFEMRKTGDSYPLACTQFHSLMEGRQLLRAGTLGEYRKNPNFIREIGEETTPVPSLYPTFKYEGYAWGMAIDVNSCIGCNACVVACEAENNGPVVGKSEVMRGREMHWIRIDSYHKGDLKNPEMYHQPVPCMQCENAPCELVCPVEATSHSEEGLNDMVYNRCVGTRYCSNNCPYKVRRFNFFQYADFETPSLKLMHNPNVTVRSRGVMEKCTYCVQRISAAKINAEKEDRTVRDGEIVTACQQACPTQAIVFGDVKDPNSRVSKIKGRSLNYTLLDELNTRPRTSYQARLRNPNPEIEKA